MSKLEELLNELCQKKLKNIAFLKRGMPLTKLNAVSGDIPVISGGKEPAFYCDTFNRNGENITVAGSGAGAGYVRYWNIPIFASDCFTVTGLEVIETKFLYYFMSNIQDQIYSTKKGGGVPHVHISDVENFDVPVPPIKIQREIIRILDNFTELTAELTARKKQYNFYLNSFFQEQIDNYVSLDSIGKLTRGKRFVHADATEEGIPCIHYGELYTFYGVHANKAKSHIRGNLRTKMRYAHKGDVVIVGAGENNIDIGIGVAWEGNEDIAVHDACYIFSHNQNSKYISYFLRSDLYHKQIKKYVSEGKICAISAMNLGKALIPLPSLDTQQAIVENLDSFNKLCMDITIGLPAEIEWRKKQYEYYRDKLLSFEVKCHD